jgi:hypothetical protein
MRLSRLRLRSWQRADIPRWGGAGDAPLIGEICMLVSERKVQDAYPRLQGRTNHGYCTLFNVPSRNRAVHESLQFQV